MAQGWRGGVGDNEEGPTVAVGTHGLHDHEEKDAHGNLPHSRLSGREAVADHAGALRTTETMAHVLLRVGLEEELATVASENREILMGDLDHDAARADASNLNTRRDV